MNPETVLMNKIHAGVSDEAIMFRANVGKVKLWNGRYFSTGLPKGFSDLFGVRRKDGKAVFIEVKTGAGRPSKEQIRFVKRMKELNAHAGFARSADEALEIIRTGSNEYTEGVIPWPTFESAQSRGLDLSS